MWQQSCPHAIEVLLTATKRQVLSRIKSAALWTSVVSIQSYIEKYRGRDEMGHFNQLTPAEAERLSILAEECAEVIQVIGKIQRHGFESCHPDGGPNNRALLEKELGDVSVAQHLMLESGDVDENAIGQGFTDKMFSIPQHLHHNRHLFLDYHYEGEVKS